MMRPYADEQLNRVYAMLFCDDPELYRPAGAAIQEPPWKQLFDPAATDQELREVVRDPEAESRVKILACRLMTGTAVPHEQAHLFGVVIEVSMAEGLDVLAVYQDGSARYINYSGKLIVWDAKSTEFQQLVDRLFAVAGTVVRQIGPWDGERLPPPVAGNARLSFLMSDGIYFGEGQFEALAADPMGGAVIDCGASLMEFLVNSVAAQEP